MSITNIRKMIENKGCQAGLIVIGVLSLVGLAGVNSFRGLFPGLGGDPKQQDVTPVVLQLGDIKMTEAQYQGVYTASTEQMGQLANQDPDFRLQFISQAASTLANQAAIKAIAAERKINLDDKSILAMVEKSIGEQVAQQKQLLVATGKVKAGATPAEIDEALKKELGGRDVAELAKQQMDAVKEQLANPSKREILVNGATVQAIIEGEAAKHQVSDADLKKDYDNFSLDQIPLQDSTVSIDERKALAAKALADLKAGKTIDEVRAAYAPKETKAPVTMSRGMINLDPVLKPLGDLKAGDWSEVLVYQGFPVIYRISKIESNLPKDFDQNVAKYRESHSMTLAQKEITTLVEEKVKSVKWISPGLELAVRFQKETSDREVNADTTKRKATLQKLNDEAKALASKAPAAASKDGTSIATNSRIDDEVAALVRNATSKQLYAMATPTEQQDMAKDRLEAMNAVLQFVDSTNLRMDIVDVALKAGDLEAAGESLVEAAMTLGRPDPVTEASYASISKKFEDLKKDKKISDDTAKKVDDALKQWLNDKIQYQKDQDELNKQNEERDKALKAEADKLEADRKAAEKDKKPTGTPTPGTPKAQGSGDGKSLSDQFLAPDAKKGN